MKLFVTRHGETEWNEKHIISGLSEVSLAPKGIEQAQTLAALLAERQNEYQIRHIVVSYLQRARVTASYIEKALGITAVVEPRIHEFNFGDFETTSTRGEEFLKSKANPYKRFPSGESILLAAHRAYSAIEDAKKRYAPDNVLFVCHGQISAIIATYFRDFDSIDEFMRFNPKNCDLQIYDL